MDETAFIGQFNRWQGSIGDETQAFDETDLPKYDELCSLYLRASPDQRRRLPSIVAPEHSPVADYRAGNLIYGYMRLIADLIRTPGDVQLLRLGLAAAALVERPLDWRDVLVSLAFLYHGAAQAGIDPQPYFKEIADSANPVTSDFIRGFLRRGNRDIEQLARDFSDLR
jgi:hypothetical protein